MQTTIAGRDAAFVGQDTSISNRDAHQVYVNELVAQAHSILESLKRKKHMTMTLLDHIDIA